MDIICMSGNDRIVYEALVKLLKEKGNNTIITHSEISSAAGTTYRTTRRALWRLSVQQMIERQRVDGNYYRYSTSKPVSG